MDNTPEAIRNVICEVLAAPVVEDGVRFDPETVETRTIREDAEYQGVRATFRAELAGARLPMQIDIGFGDVIVPEPGTIEYPTLLDFPSPTLRAYPREAVVAEKLHAMAHLRLLNSRVKDYFDLWVLPRMYSFDGTTLVEAIRATFRHRDTAVDPDPIGLTAEYAKQPARAAQWRAFLQTNRITIAPAALQDVVSGVAAFSLPALAVAASNRRIAMVWENGTWSHTPGRK